jgi:nifR3 family TIM-barrel protein
MKSEAPSPAPGRPPALHIDGLAVAPPILLAPMSSLTTLAMRTLCEEAGCGLTVTEFIAAPAIAAKVPREMRKLTASLEGRPFGVQIFGRHPDQMRRAAQRVVEATGADIVDINMGCPAKKVTKGVAGAALMREPELAEELVHAVVDGVGERARITVKIRTGWDASNRNAPDFAARMVDAGARAVTIHGRTRMQGFAGEVDLETIKKVKQALSVPVIGNGDVVDVSSMERMFEETGCDGVMVGRAALGNPWIFKSFLAWWEGRAQPQQPTYQDRMEMYLRHLHLYRQTTDEESRAVVEMRKFAGWYLKHFPAASKLRKQIYTLTDIDSIEDLIRRTSE